MSGDAVLVIDQGTTGSRAVVLDAAGTRLAGAYRPHRQLHPQPGFVEHDALEILAAVLACLADVLREVPERRIVGLAITNQRETVVVWDRATGRPIAPAIVWQDTRTADACTSLAAHADAVRRLTGLPIQPYFSATKIAWILDRVPGARSRAADGALAAGTIECWLAWNLTGAHISDATNASRTLLVDTSTFRFDEGLCELFGVPAALLPEVVPTTGHLATTLPDRAVGLAMPLLAMIGDQQAALVGQGCVRAGQAKCTYGTGAFLLAHAGGRRPEASPSLLATPALGGPGVATTYCLEGPIAVAGRAVQWLRDEVGLIADAAETGPLAGSVEDSGGVVFVPAHQGLYAPWWDTTARGSIQGLSLHSTRAHIVRATLESIAFSTRAVLDAAHAETGLMVDELRVDGGMTGNDVFIQILADLVGVPVLRSSDHDATARGVGAAALAEAGLIEAPEQLAASTERVEPVLPEADRAERHRAFLRAVERSRGWL